LSRAAGTGSLQRVLIANRGEIARRLIAACRTMGLRAYAVASDADALADWHRDADDVLRLPGSTATETYLDAERILAAARTVGADALHPGYGFLSENAAFAEACQANGIAFVGPPPAAIRAMGSKVEAIELARAAGVPTVPSISGAGLSEADMVRAADRIGFPLLIKASAGGGGRGMRLVRAPGELADGIASARAEAASAFGDDTLLLERYFERARHVEIQVLGDAHGNLIHLSERECSIQRRYQKIIEEAPSPGIGNDEELRSRMAESALALAAAVGYTSAGTVEFLLDSDGAFYFLEMNTRLQVEHPVTEAVTGVDIATWQLRVADGEVLDLDQAAVAPRGHALECRVYAEDPASGFLPSIGRLEAYRPPRGPGVRCDDGLAAGDSITSHYDPMIAKIIAHAADRPSAIARARLALRDTVVLGVTTNIDYMRAILEHPEFFDGHTDTRFLDRHFAAWCPQDHLDDAVWHVAAALEVLGAATGGRSGQRRTEGGGQAAGRDPWSNPDLAAWRLAP